MKENHRSGGLPDGGHDGGQRGRRVIAARTPAGPTVRPKRKAVRAPSRARARARAQARARPRGAAPPSDPALIDF